MRGEFDVTAQLPETAAGRSDAPQVNTAISRTSWKHYVAELVLPLDTLVSMAVLTVVVIVVVVTTVAEAGLHVQGDGGNVWSRWASSPACSVWDHRSAYASLAPLPDPTLVNGGEPSTVVPDEIDSRRVALRLGDE